MGQTESPMKAANLMTSSLLSGHKGSAVGFCTHRITAVVSDLKAAWSPEQAENSEAHVWDIVLWVGQPWGSAGAKQGHKV